ncbi:sensor histidine kinase [Halobacillus salinarum]|uniref:histidine kinase n=1 Tax=Halobacillus salinarum TaxID=2932257 RepID=A0ABY4EP63_9BACI|nr:sensor histidine kinase [Halobacillus salinarum]UOQ45943.1 sensor histidine kinase [Halobacillus salinarum]
MIWKFLIERSSWILLFVCIQALYLLIALIDPSISFRSLLYAAFLSLLLFIFFLILRYSKETKFYKQLEERESNFDLTTIPEHSSPFESLIEESMILQIEELKQQASNNKRTMEEAKDELLSWIHEVKTPLTAMHLMIERMEDQKTKEQLTYEWLRIHLLLDRQLHQERMPVITNDLYIEKVDLQTLAAEEITPLRSWCRQKGIGFDLHLESREVLSDAKWLAFILRQLLTNAVKYSTQNDIQINSYEEDGKIHLNIRDKGRGIYPQDLPRIFEKGFTSTAQHQDNASTGMGLYLTKKIADLLLIAITVSSTPGKGTSFLLTFPKQNEFVKIRGM